MMSQTTHETQGFDGQIGAKFLDMKPTVETGAPAIIGTRHVMKPTIGVSHPSNETHLADGHRGHFEDEFHWRRAPSNYQGPQVE